MRSLFFLFAAGSIAFNAAAQVVSVDVKLDQDQFLPGETLPITVNVHNRSGQTLHLGADQQWLTFSIQSVGNTTAVIRNSEPDVIKPFDLDSSMVASRIVDIAPHFGLKRPGHYRIVATVHINQWGTDVSSPPKEFDIIDGADIWSRDFGVPSDATNRPPEVRKYILEEANYLRQQLRLYVLVSNPSRSVVYKVTAIGPMVSFSQPDVQFDRKSNLHIMYQSAAQTFIYSEVNPDGTLVQQEAYDVLDTRPHLAVTEQGDIFVAGGVRRVHPEEVPTVRMPDELPSATPAATSAPPKVATPIQPPRKQGMGKR